MGDSEMIILECGELGGKGRYIVSERDRTTGKRKGTQIVKNYVLEI